MQRSREHEERYAKLLETWEQQARRLKRVANSPSTTLGYYYFLEARLLGSSLDFLAIDARVGLFPYCW